MTEQNNKNSNFNNNKERDRELGQFKRPVKPVSKSSSSDTQNEKSSIYTNVNSSKANVDKDKIRKNNNLDGTSVFNFGEEEKVKPINRNKQDATQKINLDDVKTRQNNKSSDFTPRKSEASISKSNNVDSRTKSISSAEIKKYYQEKSDNIFATKDIEITYRDREADNEPVIKNLAKITILNSAKKDIPFFNRFKRKGPNKIYRLKGFANKEYAKQVRKNKQNYIKWANRIFWILLAVTLLIVYYFIDPMERINALKHMLGMD